MQQPAAARIAEDRTSTCVLVLGMHRSGTSALTRVLNLLGVALGENLMHAAEGNNETGFWEHQGIVDVHDALLASFGMFWHDPRRLPDGWTRTPAADIARTAIREIVAKEFGGELLWGVKDPRMCRLLPLWRPLLEELGVRPVAVHMLRQPLEIARSLERRDELPRGQGLLLWLRHEIEAYRASQGLGQAWVAYDALVADWRSAILPVGSKIGIDLATDSAAVADEIDKFLKPTLRHHALDGEALTRDPDLAAWVGAIYTEIKKQQSEDNSDFLEIADRVEAEVDRAALYFDHAYLMASRVEIKLRAEITERDAGIIERDTRIAERDTRIAERDTRIVERELRIAERDRAIAERDRSLAERDAWLSTKDSEASDRDRQIRDLSRTAHDLHTQIRLSEENFNAKIIELNRLLDDSRSEVKSYRTSTSWKITAPIRRLGRPFKRIRRIGHPTSFVVNPVSDVRRSTFGWATSGSDPHFVLTPAGDHKLPRGIVRLRYNLELANTNWCEPQLYFGIDGQYEEIRSIKLPPTLGNRTEVTLLFPNYATDLRFDIPSDIGDFRLQDVSVQSLSGSAADWHWGLGWLSTVIRGRAPVGRILNDMILSLSSHGRATLRARRLGEIWSGQSLTYDSWINSYDKITPRDRELIRDRIAGLPEKPIISIVMPVYDPPPQFLSEAIESVVRQLYPHWELCIADDCSSNPEIDQILNHWEQADHRIKITRRAENGHISRASNSALSIATGDFLALLDHDDLLAEHALYMIVETITTYPDTDVVYSDEDKIDESGRRCNPYFKPDFNFDFFYSQNFINHFGVYRRKLVEMVGGFREGFEGSQDYDLALRVIERSAVDRIRHIPHVLYHWRVLEGSIALSADQKSYAHDRASKALAEHFERRYVAAAVEEAPIGNYRRVRYAVPTPAPRVSVIIPTRDHVELLRTAVGSLLEKTDYPDIEILIVDNGSIKEDTLAYFKSLIASEPTVRILTDNGQFNYSRLNNMAAAEATGDILCLLNNDTEVIHGDWLSEMVGHAMRPEVGAVGAKLYYSDGRIQHAGVVVGIGGVAGHVFIRHEGDTSGYFSRAKLTQCYSAVTAACLVTRRKVYNEIGGLDETNLTVAFNDIDYCLRAGEAGYSVVWTPFSELYHHESASRGSDEDPARRARFRNEADYMRGRWSRVISNDPFYNPNLSLNHDDFRLAFPPRAAKPWMKR